MPSPSSTLLHEDRINEMIKAITSSQMSQMSEAMTPTSHQLSLASEVMSRSVDRRMEALASSEQWAEAMVPTSRQLSQASEAMSQSADRRMEALASSEQWAEAMVPTSRQLSQASEVMSRSVDRRMKALIQSGQWAEALTPALNEIAEQMVTGESFGSIAIGYSGLHSRQQPSLSDDDLSSEIASFQVRSLTEVVYQTLANQGIELTPITVIQIEMALLYILYTHYPDQFELRLLVIGAAQLALVLSDR